MGEGVLALLLELESWLLVLAVCSAFYLWFSFSFFFLVVGAKVGLLASLSLNFFICKLKLIIPIAQGYGEEHQTLCVHVRCKWKRIFLAVELV